MFHKHFKSGCIVLTLLLSTLLAHADEVSDHIAAARDYMADKQWSYANYEWRAALEKDPKNLEATLGLAQSLNSGGYLKESIEFLQKSRPTPPLSIIDLTLAQDYQQAGDPLSACDIYESLLTRDRYNPDIYKGGSALLSSLPKDRKDKLTAELDAAASESLKKAQDALNAKQYADAAQYYEIPVNYFKTLNIVNDYGLALLLSGQNQKAYQQFNVLTNQKVHHWLLNANSALADLSVGNTGQAVSQMEKAIGQCNNVKAKARLYNDLGFLYERSRRFMNARHAYEHALQLDPSLLKAQYNLGYILQKSQEYKEALAVYNNLIAQNPNNAEAWNSLGFTYELMDKEKPALAAYQKAIEINPRYKEAYFNMGALYKKMDKTANSAEAYKHVSEIQFQEIEKPQLSTEPEGQAKILKYVDVFYSKEAES